MSQPRGPRSNERDEALREQGLQIATRFVATLRTGRSYSIGNQAFTRQLQQLLDALLPVMADHGEALVVSLDGDLHVNGVRLPLRSASLKFLEQLAQEFQVREIAGVEFRAGLTLAELEGFMRYFMPSELYKGAELHHACSTQDFRHVMPVDSADFEEPAEASTPPGPELAGAMSAYARALQNAQLLLADSASHEGLELRHLKRVSQPLVDAACSADPGAGALADAKSPGGTAWEHAVHVCALAVSVGRQLGIDRAALSELGVAALLHDAGKHEVGGLVARPLAQRGPAERADGEGHTIAGLRHIALMTTLNATSLTAMRVALEHHATGTGGYPSLSPGWRPAPASQIVAIADAFVSQLEHHEPGHAGMTPCEALGRVLGPLAPRFHPALRAALVRALGVFPPGQVMELDDGSIVRALGPGSTDPERPLVEWLAAGGGAAVAPASPSPGPLPTDRSVRRALPLEEWPGHSRAA